MNVVVGHSSEFIDGGRPKCRLEECGFGDLVTDAMAEEMDVDIAVINSGAIKGSFPKGERRRPVARKYAGNFGSLSRVHSAYLWLVHRANKARATKQSRNLGNRPK